MSGPPPGEGLPWRALWNLVRWSNPPAWRCLCPLQAESLKLQELSHAWESPVDIVKMQVLVHSVGGAWDSAFLTSSWVRLMLLVHSSLIFFLMNIYHLFIWLCQISVAACRIFTAAPELSSLWYVGSVVAVYELSCPAACGILVPQPGIEPVSSALPVGFLTLGPPGKSPQLTFWFSRIYKAGGKDSLE